MDRGDEPAVDARSADAAPPPLPLPPSHAAPSKRLPPALGEVVCVYRDESLVVVEKPSNLLSVPGRGEDKADCVVARVSAWLIGGAGGAGALAVHRLDFETSGLMVVALDAAAHRHLSRQFEERHVEKAYVAVLDGLVEPDEGEVRMRIRVDWDARPRQMVCEEHGRDSHTRFRVLARADGRTRVEFTPITGRSHQLRVHSAFSRRVGGLGCAILGDPLYASGAALDHPRLCLHATRLAFTHPVRGDRVEFVSEPPF